MIGLKDVAGIVGYDVEIFANGPTEDGRREHKRHELVQLCSLETQDVRSAHGQAKTLENLQFNDVIDTQRIGRIRPACPCVSMRSIPANHP